MWLGSNPFEIDFQAHFEFMFSANVLPLWRKLKRDESWHLSAMESRFSATLRQQGWNARDDAEEWNYHHLWQFFTFFAADSRGAAAYANNGGIHKWYTLYVWGKSSVGVSANGALFWQVALTKATCICGRGEYGGVCVCVCVCRETFYSRNLF